MKLYRDKKLHVRRLEKIEIIEAFKIMGNEYRMNMLLLLKTNPKLTLEQINERVGGDFKNISKHMKKLSQSGLVQKTYKGSFVEHSLTEYGKRAVASFDLFSKDLT